MIDINSIIADNKKLNSMIMHYKNIIVKSKLDLMEINIKINQADNRLYNELKKYDNFNKLINLKLKI